MTTTLDRTTAQSSNAKAGCFVLGIAGGSASGKSTLANTLKTVLQDPPARVEVLAMDTYKHKDTSDRPTVVLSRTGETLFDWNHPDSFECARLADDIRLRSSAADSPDVLIVEGHMVLAAPVVRELLHVAIFVDLPADVRAVRRLLRDMTGVRGSRDPRFISEYYLECARAGHEQFVEPSRNYADLIVRGDADFGHIAALIAAIVNGSRPPT